MSITTFINPYSYWVLRRYPHLLADHRIRYEYDGISLCILARLLGGKKERRSFDDTSLAPKVFHDASVNGRSVSLVGSAPGVATAAAAILTARYPQLDIRLAQHGYMTSNERTEVLRLCTDSDVVVCSMGTPHQENFLLDLSNLGWRGDGYTCGGYLDQLVASDGADYYPDIFNTLHLRWLYRIIREPQRLIFRYTCIYPLGCIAFLIDGWRRRANLSKPV